jgi:hypothetical protein
MPWYVKGLGDFNNAAAGGRGFMLVRAYIMADTAVHAATTGDLATAERLVGEGKPFDEQVRKLSAPGSLPTLLVTAAETLPAAQIAYQRDDLSTAHRLTSQVVGPFRDAQPVGSHEELQKSSVMYATSLVMTRVEFGRGDYVAAENAAREGLKFRKIVSYGSVQDFREVNELATWLTLALVRQGRLAEAAQTIAPVVKFQRDLKPKNHGDVWQGYELANALYAQALTDPKQAPALLREATSLFDQLPPSMRNLHDVRQWRARIEAARRKAG